MEGLLFGVLRYLVIILVVKERFERFSCLKFVFEKSKHREAAGSRPRGGTAIYGLYRYVPL